MSVKPTTDPKIPTSATSAAKHGCCGSEAAAESQTDAATDHEHREHAVPSKAAESSCCCGGKDGRTAA
jgi:hypothetical protein